MHGDINGRLSREYHRQQRNPNSQLPMFKHATMPKSTQKNIHEYFHQQINLTLTSNPIRKETVSYRRILTRSKTQRRDEERAAINYILTPCS